MRKHGQNTMTYAFPCDLYFLDLNILLWIIINSEKKIQEINFCKSLNDCLYLAKTQPILHNFCISDLIAFLDYIQINN